LLAPTKRGRQNHKRTSGLSTAGENFGVKKITPEIVPLHKPGSVANCDTVITPECIRALYGIPKKPEYPHGKPRADNSLGIFEEGDVYAQEDLDLFFANYSSNIPKGTSPTPAFIDGAQAPTDVADAGGESDLDFELAYPIVYPQTITLYQTDDLYEATHAQGAFNTFLDAIDGSYCTYLAFGETGNDPDIDPVYPDANGYKGQLQCGKYKPTNVISVSYGGQEADLPAYYQQRQCNEFMKLGLQGISIFYASGDDGVAGPSGDENDNGCLGKDAEIFSPAWPNSCPYVTNVGATKVYPGKTVKDPESAAYDPAGHPYRSAFASGGGFSNIYPQPDYQKAAVATYFSQHDPGYKYYSSKGNNSFGANGGLYNRLGRG
jgi:tripeptidyl-peptidase-1